METRRLLLAALLSMAVLLLWQKFFPAPAPVQEPAAPTAAAERERPTSSDGSDNWSEDWSENRPENGPGGRSATATDESSAASEAADAADATQAPAAPELSATAEQTVVLENENVRAVWSNRGAQLLHLELRNHPTSDGGTVDLVRQQVSGEGLFRLVDATGESLPLNEALFKVSRSGQTATFEYRGPAGRARKRVALQAGGTHDIEIDAAGEWQVVVGPGLRNPNAEEAKSRFARRAAIYKQGGELERIESPKAKELAALSGTGLSWVGLQDQYFLAAMLPKDGLDEVVVEPMLFEVDEEGRYSFAARTAALADSELGDELRLRMVPDRGRLTFSAYLGSKQYDRLAALGLQDAVDLGIFGIIGRPLLIALRWIYENVVSNYGWAIILLTVLLRIVLFPLNHKSIVSMQKMQQLNPKMQAIRAKYRSKLKDKKGRPNPEASSKMNQEIMALYKSEGVNPAGGCLPMLLQMPVLFAFYGLLSAAVELRHAPWLGWITDLSAPDRFYVLPIVMGVSMIAQQKLTPTQGDPMQRKMFMLMPIVFTFLFLGFPAGMVLYWLTNNILAIAQQLGYKRFRAAADATGDAGGQK